MIENNINQNKTENNNNNGDEEIKTNLNINKIKNSKINTNSNLNEVSYNFKNFPYNNNFQNEKEENQNQSFENMLENIDKMISKEIIIKKNYDKKNSNDNFFDGSFSLSDFQMKDKKNFDNTKKIPTSSLDKIENSDIQVKFLDSFEDDPKKSNNINNKENFNFKPNNFGFDFNNNNNNNYDLNFKIKNIDEKEIQTEKDENLNKKNINNYNFNVNNNNNNNRYDNFYTISTQNNNINNNNNNNNNNIKNSQMTNINKESNNTNSLNNFKKKFFLYKSQKSSGQIKFNELEIYNEILEKIKNLNKKKFIINKKDFLHKFEFIEDFPSIEKDSKTFLKYNEIEIDIDDFKEKEDLKKFLIRRSNYFEKNNLIYNLSDNNFQFTKNENEIKPNRFLENNFSTSSSFEFSEINYQFQTNKNSIKIGEINDISLLIYKFNLIQNKNLCLSMFKIFNNYRNILNDGFSFQRAFFFSFIEHLINSNNLDLLNNIINDISKGIPSDFDLRNISSVFKKIKNEYLIDDITSAFNDTKLNFDKLIILYIQHLINEINDESIDKYYEINYEYIKKLCDIFNCNVVIYSVDNNYSLNKNEIKTKINPNSSTEIITITLGFFFSSFHIIYLNNENDLSKSLIFSELIKKTKMIDNNYNLFFCKKCNNKNSVYVLFITLNKICCYKCLNSYIQNILIKRAISFIQNNFLDIEFYTRPILIEEKKDNEKICITNSIYSSIFKKLIVQDFYELIENICFNCFKVFNVEDNKIVKIKNCQCQFCHECLGIFINKFTKGLKVLNSYEKKTFPKISCLCKNEFNYEEALEYYKKEIDNKDILNAQERLENVFNNICCICLEKQDKFDFINLNISNNNHQHLICKKCYDEEKINSSFNNFLNENDNSSMFNFSNKNQSVYCKLCDQQHFLNNKNKRKKRDADEKCCNKNCVLF